MGKSEGTVGTDVPAVETFELGASGWGRRQPLFALQINGVLAPGSSASVKLVAQSDFDTRGVTAQVLYMNSSPDYHHLEHEQVPLQLTTGQVAAGQEFEIEIDVPSGALPHLVTEHGWASWVLLVRTDIPRGRDMTEHHPFEVEAVSGSGHPAAVREVQEAGAPAEFSAPLTVPLVGAAVALGLFASPIAGAAGGVVAVGYLASRVMASRSSKAWDVEMRANAVSVGRGESLELTVDIAAPSAERKLEAGLLGTEFYDIERSDDEGTSRVTKKATITESWAALDGASPQQTVTLEIPPAAQFSYAGDALRVEWAVAVREKRRAADPRRELPIQILV